MRPARALLAAMLLAAGGSHAADAARGAQLYMRTDADTRSCVSCHGPDPGQNPNNILRAADSPDTLTKVLNTVSQMGFLRSQLSDADRADIAAFLGSVTRLNAAATGIRAWPVTLDFGTLAPATDSATQSIRLANPSATQPLGLAGITVTDPQAILTHNCPAELAPATACEVQVRTRLAAAGLFRAAVQVASPALTTPVLVGLTAAGTSATPSALGWQGNPAQLRFESAAGATQVRQALVLANPGPLPAVIGLLSIVGPDAARFSIERTACAQGSVLVAGTSCEMQLIYTPGLADSTQATLQLRSDQANPPSLRLEGARTPPMPAETLPAEGGGGCSTRPPGGPKDPLLPLLAVLATAWALWRPRRGARCPA